MNLFFSIILIMAVGLFISVLYRLKKMLAQRDKVIGELQRDISALSAGAVGVSEHVSRIERDMQEVRECQSQLAIGTRIDQSYGEAIRLVHEGADVKELMDSCGLVRDEAELIRTVHNMREAG